MLLSCEFCGFVGCLCGWNFAAGCLIAGFLVGLGVHFGLVGFTLIVWFGVLCSVWWAISALFGCVLWCGVG